MWGKSYFIISLVLACILPTLAGQQDEAPKLPDNLAETESRLILKERNGKPHVEAATKVAEARLQNAVKLAEAGQAEDAVRDLNVYAALFSYADAFAHQLPPNEQKERNKCLKEIEQAIFKQQRLLEAARRELPFNYREQTDGLVETLKRIRLRAINDMLGGGTIIK